MPPAASECSAMKVVALFRVSTERQANEGASLDAQERTFHDLAAKSGWETVGTFKGTESATMAATERRVLQQALACIREKEANAIWVIEQSRLSRGDELEVALLQRELRERSVKVIVGTSIRNLESIDESFMFNVQSLVDRAESQRIKERMGRGKREKAKRGKKNSGPAPYGYRNPSPGADGRGTLVVVPEQAAVVRRIFDLAAAGKGDAAIATALNHAGVPAARGGGWGKSSVASVLRNVAYLGTAASNIWVAEKGSRNFRLRLSNDRAIVVEHAHPAIVDQAAWDAYHNRPKAVRAKTPRLLSGLLYVNGTAFGGDASRGAAFYRGPRGAKGHPWLPAGAADDAVWSAYASLATSPEFVERLMREAANPREQALLAQEIEHLRDQVGKHERRLERLVSMRADGEISKETFAARRDEATQALGRMNAELADLRSRAMVLDGTHAARVVRAVQSLLAGRTRLSTEQKRAVLRSIVTRVDVVAVPTGARQQRGAKGGYAESGGPSWLYQSVSFRLMLPSEEPRGCDAGTPKNQPAEARARVGQLGTTSYDCGQVAGTGQGDGAERRGGQLGTTCWDCDQVTVTVGVA